MDNSMEMTVSLCYNAMGLRRLRLLKLLRIALVVCLFMAWTYGIAVAAAFVQEASGAATRWMMQFVIYTIPATVMLILVWILLAKMERCYDYCLHDDELEIWCNGSFDHRKLVVQVNCFAIHAFTPEIEAPNHDGRQIRATVSRENVWALDVRHDEQIVRIWLQPNEAFAEKLRTYIS